MMASGVAPVKLPVQLEHTAADVAAPADTALVVIHVTSPMGDVRKDVRSDTEAADVIVHVHHQHGVKAAERHAIVWIVSVTTAPGASCPTSVLKDGTGTPASSAAPVVHGVMVTSIGVSTIVTVIGNAMWRVEGVPMVIAGQDTRQMILASVKRVQMVCMESTVRIVVHVRIQEKCV